MSDKFTIFSEGPSEHSSKIFGLSSCKTESVIVFSNAKINIGLSINGKRPDGYHDLESVFYPVPLCDIIEIVPTYSDNFIVSGIPISTRHNLVLDAINLIRSDFSIPPISVHIHKQIPLGAGLGGGSSNATHTLKLLNQVFQLNLSREVLLKYALELGSDCPFFVDNQAAVVKGRGEILESTILDLTGVYVKLVHTGIHISTKTAFENLDFNRMKESVDMSRIGINQIELLKNDFQSSAANTYHEIEMAIEELKEEGAFYVSMTGTGSTVFGLFKEMPTSTIGVYKL